MSDAESSSSSEFVDADPLEFWWPGGGGGNGKSSKFWQFSKFGREEHSRVSKNVTVFLLCGILALAALQQGSCWGGGGITAWRGAGSIPLAVVLKFCTGWFRGKVCMKEFEDWSWKFCWCGWWCNITPAGCWNKENKFYLAKICNKLCFLCYPNLWTLLFVVIYYLISINTQWGIHCCCVMSTQNSEPSNVNNNAIITAWLNQTVVGIIR